MPVSPVEKEREGELLQVMYIPRGASLGTCNKVKVTTVLFCSLGIITKPRKIIRETVSKRYIGTFLNITH